ncbi:hypothetical protein MAPG_07510 [Magnaporthiopsis poae ATCC 64411]|uniref:Uncharacterized protein n=1 Tax=Magnaporthiopsis poae (strain ATCC 64411 / 73-15) TaxID=644358 RepID=A0A0C4E4V7_MAGP6|nr:hypothetical protein MAPG_07510 [Magnaporthiopsis poae ATCC 64411]
MPATGPSSPVGQSTPPMVYRPTSPDRESQRLMASAADGGRYDNDDDDDRRRSLRVRFHLVNWLRLLVALLSIASICLTAGGDTLIPAAIPVFVFGSLAAFWNGVILFDWAFDCWGRRPRCLCLRLPTCLCQLGACRLGCGEADDDEDDAAEAVEKRRPRRLGTNALWVVDLLFAVPFLISPAIYNAQAELHWWARYNRDKLVALNFMIWPICVLFILVAALQHTRLGRGVTITITPDDQAPDPYRSPRRSPP